MGWLNLGRQPATPMPACLDEREDDNEIMDGDALKQHTPVMRHRHSGGSAHSRRKAAIYYR